MAASADAAIHRLGNYARAVSAATQGDTNNQRDKARTLMSFIRVLESGDGAI
jgi:hypothetical protein